MKIISSFRFALQGIVAAFRTQLNFRIECFAALFAVALGLWLNISLIEWLIVVINISLVLFLELLNTSLEKACDLFSKDFHPSIEFIKDVAAAGVFISALGAFVCGLIIFLPKIIHHFQ